MITEYNFIISVMILPLKANKYNYFFLCSFFLFCILITFSCKVKEEVKKEKTGIIHHPAELEKKAEFEDGDHRFIKFLSSNLEYPQEAIHKNIQGKVIIKFVVEEDGTIDNFVALKDIGGGCADEVIRVLLKTQGRWNSAKIKRERVRSYYFVSVVFKMPNDDSKPSLQVDIK